MKNFILLLGVITLISCSKNDSCLEYALQIAGENGTELTKVLNHYKKNPADSLKLKAAEFLISNMPWHYAYDSEKLKHFRNEILTTQRDSNVIEDVAMKILGDKYGEFSYDNSDIVFDSKIITSEYLIRNIEHSFMVWENIGWKNLISFNDFCEDILPYRVSTEPLEEWRENYYNTFQPLLDSLLVNKEDPVEACQILYDYIIEED